MCLFIIFMALVIYFLGAYTAYTILTKEEKASEDDAKILCWSWPALAIFGIIAAIIPPVFKVFSKVFFFIFKMIFDAICKIV